MRPAVVASTLVAACTLGHCCQAAQVDLSGTTVRYLYDDTQPALALLGAPSLLGDTLRFLPANLSVSAPDEGVTGARNLDLVLRLRVEPLAVLALSQARFELSGLRLQGVFFEPAVARTGLGYATLSDGVPVTSAQVDFPALSRAGFPAYEPWELSAPPSAGMRSNSGSS